MLVAFTAVQHLAFTAPGCDGQSLPRRILRRAEPSDSRDLPGAAVQDGHLLASNLTGAELLNVLREAPRQGDARVKSAEVLRCLGNGEGSKEAISCTDAVDFTLLGLILEWLCMALS